MILYQVSGVTVTLVALAESAVGDFGVFIMTAVELKKLSLHYEVSKCFLGFDDDVLVVSNLVG